jgi:hypothetical protein
MKRTVRHQARDVAQLHQTIDWMTKMPHTHMACDNVEWCGMTEWLEDWETQWDDHHKDNELLVMVITDNTVKVLVNARIGKAAPAQQARKKE